MRSTFRTTTNHASKHIRLQIGGKAATRCSDVLWQTTITPTSKALFSKIHMNSAVFGSVAQSVDVLITGSGRLARAVAYSLATVRDYNIQVLLVARCSDAMKEVVTVARARATAFGSQIAFAGIVSDFASVPAMDDVMSSYRPRLILHTASLQSPWDITKPSTSRWADLVHRSGFGLTLPLQ